MTVVERANNPLHPLPADYYQLTAEGQREARVNACRQWLLHPIYGGYRVDAFDMHAGLNFFTSYYLKQGFSKGYSSWYDVEPCPDGPHQRAIREALHLYNKSIVVAPRGFAKTSELRADILLALVTSMFFQVVYITSKEKFTRATFRKITREIEDNAVLNDDFRPEYGGWLSPPKGSTMPWSPYSSEIQLVNKSELLGGSTEGALRSLRPRWLIMDDPERDAKPTTDMQSVRDVMESLIFKVMKPMVRDKRRRFLWSGTRISKQHLLYAATAVDPETGRLTDERFRFWERLVYKAGYPSLDNLQTALWPEYMSVEDIRQEERESGREFVLSEYFNEPGESAANVLRLDAKHHSYEIEAGEDGVLNLATPRESSARIKWWCEKTKETKVMTMTEFLHPHHALVFLTVDWARTVSRTADYSAVAVMAVTPDNELFVLDLYEDKVPQSVLTANVLRLAYKWRCRVLGVEAYSVYEELMTQMQTELARFNQMHGYRPTLTEVKPHGMTKGEKIQGLQWRFGDEVRLRGLIKLPFAWRAQKPWRSLFNQIEGFNPHADQYGLQHDDVLDCVAMSQKVIRGTPGGVKKAKEVETPLDMLLDGKTYHPRTGMRLAEMIDPLSLPPDVLKEVERAQDARIQRERGNKAANRI